MASSMRNTSLPMSAIEADHAELAVLLLHNGAVRRGAVPPAADLHDGADRALPARCGAGRRASVSATVVPRRNGIPSVLVHGDKLLLLDLGQGVGKLKIIDKLFLQKRTLHRFALYGACHFDKVAEQHTDLRVVCKAARAHPAVNASAIVTTSSTKFHLSHIIHRGGPWQDGKIQK